MQDSSTSFLKEKVLIILLYLLLALLLSSYYKYFLHLPDTFQYLVIAENYSKGNFPDAINSYWSPLFSWVLALLIKIGIDPFSSLQVLQIFSGFASLLGIFKLIPFNNQNRFLFLLFHFSFSILILSFALLVATPDLLLLTITVWYLVLISKKEYYLNSTYSFLILGSMGALLYFSKAAGFFFFLLSFTLINCLFFFNTTSDKYKISWKYFSALGVFIALSSIWIFIISKKENTFLISSASEYNFNLIGPHSNPDIFGETIHPFEKIGLIPPLKESSINAWEHPNKITLDDWSPFDSEKNFTHYLKIILRNLWSLQSFYFGLDAGTILIIGILILWIYNKAGVKTIFYENRIPIIISISCTLPYLLVLIMERYVWINTVVMGILAASVSAVLINTNRRLSIVFLTLFGAFTVYKPMKELVNVNRHYENVIAEGKELSEYLSGNIASVTSDDEIKGENYTKSILISYLSRNQYFGMINVSDQNNDMSYQLKKYKIKYLLSWNSLVPDSLFSEEIIFPKSEVKIYKLR